jgi:hypothetical protein
MVRRKPIGSRNMIARGIILPTMRDQTEGDGRAPPEEAPSLASERAVIVSARSAFENFRSASCINVARAGVFRRTGMPKATLLAHMVPISDDVDFTGCIAGGDAGSGPEQVSEIGHEIERDLALARSSVGAKPPRARLAEHGMPRSTPRILPASGLLMKKLMNSMPPPPCWPPSCRCHRPEHRRLAVMPATRTPAAMRGIAG